MFVVNGSPSMWKKCKVIPPLFSIKMKGWATVPLLAGWVISLENSLVCFLPNLSDSHLTYGRRCLVVNRDNCRLILNQTRWRLNRTTLTILFLPGSMCRLKLGIAHIVAKYWRGVERKGRIIWTFTDLLYCKRQAFRISQ